MPCVFCGRKEPMSKEHVFPDWCQPYLASETGPGTHVRGILREGQRTPVNTWKAEPATTTVRAVCEPCNTRWMSDLETTAKPFLLSIIQGHGRTYHEGGLTQLATWATKTALVAGTQIDPNPPKVFYADFYERRAPSPGTAVWFGATNQREFHYTDARNLRIATLGGKLPDAVNGYAVLLAVGYLAFYVYAMDADEPPSKGFPGEFSGAFRQIWPISGPVAYPPPRFLTHDGLDTFAGTISFPQD